jgi:hypothetical protein
MKEMVLTVNYLIDDLIVSLPTKMIYDTKFIEVINEEELQSVHFEVEINQKLYISQSSDVTELSIKHLQKELPESIRIVSCISCRHGNYCPYGDQDNEIFCFKDMKFSNKSDVVDVFSTQDLAIQERCRKLLDYCMDYKQILINEYFTYNDWGLKN